MSGPRPSPSSPTPLTAEEKKRLPQQSDRRVPWLGCLLPPFGDNIERARRSGVTAIVQPGGSIRDQQVIDTCNKYGIAMVMVIENAERFGLSQLHQLRGRVGRGADQSYCILVTTYKLTEETRKRLEIMVQTNDGFEIAEADLKLRGPGDLEGTQQSG